MKRLLLGIALIAGLSACNQKEKEQIAQLEAEKVALLNQSNTKDSTINTYFESLNQIEANLAEIKAKEAVISKETSKGGELSPDVREKINEDIKLINDLMNKNKRTIARLKNEIKESNLKIVELQKMLEKMNIQLVEKDSTITALKDNLTKLNFSIQALNDTLSNVRGENQKMATEIGEKTVEINTAYFIIGKEKDLIAKKIIAKEGGFLGLGKSLKVQGNVQPDLFKKVDIRTLNSIPVNSKAITIISTHPSDSYEIVGNEKKVDELVITNSTKFWEKSKYLVIVTE
jgi:predicted  nucleic acid-binding Zn-ribbon protein